MQFLQIYKRPEFETLYVKSVWDEVIGKPVKSKKISFTYLKPCLDQISKLCWRLHLFIVLSGVFLASSWCYGSRDVTGNGRGSQP